MARRNARGQFVSGGSRALVVSRPATQVVRRPGSKIVLVPSGGGGGRRRSSSGRITKHIGTEVRKGAVIGGAVLGYLMKNQAGMMAQIPKLAGTPLITIAIGAHMYAQDNPGGYVDHIATAAAAIAAYEIGQRGFSLTGNDDNRAEW